MLAPTLEKKSPWMTPEEHAARAAEGRRLASIRLAHTDICSGVSIYTDPVESEEGGWYTHTVTAHGAAECLAYSTDEEQARINHAGWVANFRQRRSPSDQNWMLR